MNGQGTRPKAFRVKTMRGEPYTVGGRELIPVARVISYGKASATVGTTEVSGRGGGFVLVRPLAVLEVTPAGERRIDLQNGSTAAMGGIFAATAVTALVFSAIRWLVRCKRGSSSSDL